jgi:hypothetical protein
MEVCGQLQDRPLYPRGMCSMYTFSRELRSPRAGLDAAVAKRIFALAGNRTPVFNPVINHYTKIKLDSMSGVKCSSLYV